MENDEELLAKISQTNLGYTLHVDSRSFDLDNVSLIKSKIPVRKPTTRGGVYFTDTTAYKMKAITNDPSIIDLLPHLMLGPNSDFKPVEIKTKFEMKGSKKDIILITHIVNTVNTKKFVEINMIVDEIRLG